MEQQRSRQHVEKPRLEIPDSKLSPGNASSSSPRSMHGFPTSPEYVSSSGRDVKSFEDWSSQSAASLVPAISSQDDAAGVVEVVGRKRLHFYVGEFVLVRCNHTKWLLGQVRRSSRNGVIVWVGAAQTLVNVPYDLLVSHFVKLDSPSLPASPPSSLPPETLVEVGRDGQILAPFQCVRPAHLSHRKLFQPLKFFSTDGNQGNSAFAAASSMQHNEVREGGSDGVRREMLFLADRGSASLPAYTPGKLETLEVFKGLKDTQEAGQRTSQPSYSLCRFRFSEDDTSSIASRASESVSTGNNRLIKKWASSSGSR
ncbi:uncharacterized protein LOC112347844 [Selaginella moellendorffii]|uniref:uncharacterized protein LOC112347844 n=1 Tax=Selaginella moellendorffii TaxID=88036 RepID=UPI000D1C7887|nr:uncharacterized protein LOC112347844 [Selaginella moellendorffii]|eukprot:XP_024535152.1 uncharacterized protein LOC112347844 [Selaginella moellendorffii]